MKKVNLKGKLGLKKETMSKLAMNEVSGGATAACPPGSLLQVCTSAKCQSLVCQTLQLKCTIQTVQTCAFICTTGPTTGAVTEFYC